MNTIVKASLILTGLVTVLNLIVQATGLHKDFMLGQTLFLVGAIALNVGVVYWALARDASTNAYGLQLLTALGIGLLAGLLIVVVSWFLLGVAFPSSLDEMREGAIAYMQEAGTPEAEYQRQVEMLDKATPMSQSVPGGVGTLFTSLLSGAIIAAFKRKK